jgi:DNA invertase Pin-like site-specific DNA recombinase
MILGYVRVSSADQAKDDRSSLQTQTDMIEGFARIRGVDKFGVQIYTDAGVSGATKLALRPAGSDLLAAMRKGDTVIASKLDRMFRSASDALNMFDVFREKGVDLILYDISSQSILESAIAKLIMTVMAAVADMERVRIKERTADGRRAKKAKGGPVGKVPFGYIKVGVGHDSTLAVNEREQRAAKLMQLLFAARWKPTDISRQLAQEGFVSRTGKPYTWGAIRNVVSRMIPEVAQ